MCAHFLLILTLKLYLAVSYFGGYILYRQLHQIKKTAKYWYFKVSKYNKLTQFNWESPSQFENRIMAPVYVRSITHYYVPKSSILLAGTGVLKISSVAY